MTATLNTLIDHAPLDPDAPAPLTEPCLMSVHELCATHAEYSRRIHHDLIWREATLTPDEKAHALAVEEQYGQWQDAVRWSARRPVQEDPWDVLDEGLIEDWYMRHPIAPPTDAELAAMADAIPF